METKEYVKPDPKGSIYKISETGDGVDGNITSRKIEVQNIHNITVCIKQSY
jgi:hypothetical protein